MAEFCKEKGLDEAKVWTDYVNDMIGLARACGKTPLIWADHPSKDDRIAAGLRKDVVLVEWRYEENIEDVMLPKLKAAGFRDFIVAPSLGCYRYRFFPTEIALENTRRMAVYGARHGALGLFNTIWCPWRYLQNALYFGIAYSARQAQHGGNLDLRAFEKEFAQKEFGLPPTATLARFFNEWPKLNITFTIAPNLTSDKPNYSVPEWQQLEQINRLGPPLFELAQHVAPAKNQEMWRAFVLSAKGAWLCSEFALLRRADGRAEPARRAACKKMLEEACREMDAEWDRTRLPADPQKRKPMFPDGGNQYVLILLEELRKIMN
jgi:hypothetical protein